MRTSLLALPVKLLLGAYQLAHGESANVTGGGSCTKLKDGSMGNFDINIVGEISPETADKVRNLFDEKHAIYANGVIVSPDGSKCVPYGDGYRINSPGGNINAAIAIGRMFRKENAHIQVTERSICISACVLILAGAVDRWVSGAVGIHRPYLGTTPQQPMTANQVKDAYRTMLQNMRLWMNVSERLADDMLATEPERVHILTKAELKSYGLAGVDSAEQQRRAIENEARDVQEANRLGLDRREYTRRKTLGIQSCIYNSATGELMTDGEMLDCRERILTTGR
jgi:hypothetical protein